MFTFAFHISYVSKLSNRNRRDSRCNNSMELLGRSEKSKKVRNELLARDPISANLCIVLLYGDIH